MSGIGDKLIFTPFGFNEFGFFFDNFQNKVN
jgi:hypothetical protein